MKTSRPLPMAILPVLLILAGCEATGGPDLGPVRDGLGLIGLGIVLAAFIRMLGRQPAKPADEGRPPREEEPQ